MSVFTALRGMNQGQAISLGWSNQSNLKEITALLGTDGINFLPVKDRGFYTAGVVRALPTGGIFYSGLPTVEFLHPWISDGQIETLMTYRGNCTLRHHITESVGKNDTQDSNVIFNLDLNQLSGLERKRNGYEGFVSKFVIVEVL